MGFELDFDSRRDLGYKVIDRINDFYQSLPDRPVQPPREARTQSRRPAPLADPAAVMPEVGADPHRVLDDLTSELIDRGFHTAAATYFGLQNPTPTYMSVLAEALVATVNPQLASLVHSEIASNLERQTVRWVGERVGWSGPFDGVFTSGGSEANFTALALALAAHFPAWVEEGVGGIDARPVLYCTAEAHHSVDKAVGLLGLGRKALRHIAVTPDIQLDPALLEARIRQDKAEGFAPFCVVATAGTTSSGAVDDIDALAAICRRHRLWLHVDGAYGGALVMSDRYRHLVRGIEQADSITMDPHKWLATSMSAGMVLTSHPETLQQVFATQNVYMPKVDGATAAGGPPINSFDLGMQWSRRMNSLKLWLTLRVHGRRGYEDLIDRQLGLARSFANWVENSDAFELAGPQVLAGVIFRVKLPSASLDQQRAANEAVTQAVMRDGRFWLGTALVRGQPVIRVLVISYLSEQRHLDDLQEALLAAAKARREDDEVAVPDWTSMKVL